MIGHQSLLLYPGELREIRRSCPGALKDYKWGEFADRFFTQCLGVSEVSTMDYSSYEGAELLHDLNQPIPSELEGRFDVVVEAGSLEHVFNFPVAIANLMQMTRVGGTLFVTTVSNNLCGHGFYQFSPELIFRIFTPENGFELGKVLALEARFPGIELTPITGVFEVADPASVGSRVGLMTQRPIMLCCEARKTANLPLFAKSPMQSDYAAAWRSSDKPERSRASRWSSGLPFRSYLRNWLSEPLLRFRNRRIGLRQLKEFSLMNKRLFRKIG
jgi:hypothetical protein